MFNPIQYGLQQVGVGINTRINFFVSLKQIRDENLKLLEENQSLITELQLLRELGQENEMLKEQLNVKLYPQMDRGLILAQTMGNSQDKSGTTLIIDKGSNHDVSVGDMIVKGLLLVGVVKNVTTQRAEIELVTSPNLIISVIDFQTNTEGIVRGQYGTGMVMGQILPGENVFAGGVVVTSGRDGNFLPGYIVGEITFVEQESAQVLRNALISSYLDLENVGKVFVIPENK